MKRFNWLVVGIIQCSVLTCLHAKVKLDNLSDYNFGMVRPGYFPVKESAVSVSAANYTLVVSGQHDRNASFHLANGIYTVRYTVSWKDSSGNWLSIVPNTISSIFQGNQANNAASLATLQMQIKGNFPKPGHYSDTLTLIITPA